jgi:HEAT repeat protein
MKAFAILVLVFALSGCGNKEPMMAHGKPVQHWVQALQDPDVKTRKKAVAALGNVGAADSAAIPALILALKDRDPPVRDQAVLALLRIGPPAREAIPTLAEAKNDKDPIVRSHAAKALERIEKTS